MGCHTFFWRKEKRTYSEARIRYISAKRDEVILWEEICDNPGHRTRIKQELTQEDCMFKLKVLQRQLRMVRVGLCRVATLNKQPKEGKKCFISVNCNIYSTDDKLPYDLFRVFGYPNIKLTSLIETYEYITYFEKYNNITMNISSAQLGALRDFWEEYPDGLITFGNVC